MATLESKKIDFVPDASRIKDGATRKFAEDVVTALQKIQKDIYDDLSNMEITGYVDRGDPAAYDFVDTDLTTDGNVFDLDLSLILPANAVAVSLYVRVKDAAINKYIQFRKNGNLNWYSKDTVRTQVANQFNDGNVTIPCDTARIIEYRTSIATFTNIDIIVKGWWRKI